MTKKIVHLVYSMGCGGLEKVIVNIINGTRDLNCQHLIITLIPDFEMIDLIDVPVEVHCIHKKPGKDLLAHFRLMKRLLKIKPDVINTYNFGTIEYHAVAWLLRIPIRVHSDHGRGGDVADGRSKKNNAIRRFSSGFVSDYVVVSLDLYNWVVDIVRVRSKSVQVVQNGVPVAAIDKQPLARKHKVFCTIGRLDPVKNQMLLIKAFAHLCKTTPRYLPKLLIVGDGPERDKLESLTRALALDEYVEFLGYRTDISEILTSVDVFVLSSHYEAMPMTILEAMAKKVPVVSTDVGGIRHALDDSMLTFVAPDSVDALSQAMDKATILSTESLKIIDNAYNLVKAKYSTEAMVARYSLIYKL